MNWGRMVSTSVGYGLFIGAGLRPGSKKETGAHYAPLGINLMVIYT